MLYYALDCATQVTQKLNCQDWFLFYAYFVHVLCKPSRLQNEYAYRTFIHLVFCFPFSLYQILTMNEIPCLLCALQIAQFPLSHWRLSAFFPPCHRPDCELRAGERKLSATTKMHVSKDHGDEHEIGPRWAAAYLNRRQQPNRHIPSSDIEQ